MRVQCLTDQWVIPVNGSNPKISTSFAPSGMKKLEHTCMNSSQVSFIHYILKELQTATLKIIEWEFIAWVTFVFHSPPFWTTLSCWMWHNGRIMFCHEKDQNLSIIMVVLIERSGIQCGKSNRLWLCLQLSTSPS